MKKLKWQRERLTLRARIFRLARRWWIYGVVLLVCLFVVFFLLFWVEWDRMSTSPTYELDPGICIPNFRRVIFKSIPGRGFLFDAYRTSHGGGGDVVIMMSPNEFTARNHMKVSYPHPHRRLVVNFFTIDSVDPSLIPKKKHQVTCIREICSYTNRELSEKQSYIHIYRCPVPPLLPSSFSLSFLDDIRPGSIYTVADCTAQPAHKFAVSALAKNPGPSLAPWLSYLLFIGFHHVFLYDHSSSAPPSNTLRPYGARVSLLNLPAEKYLKTQALQLTDSIYRHNVEWMMVIDIDEFPVFLPSLPALTEDLALENVASAMFSALMFNHKKVSQKKKGIGSFLGRYETISPVFAPYEMFEKGSVRQQRSKCLFRPAATFCLPSPHLACVEKVKKGEKGQKGYYAPLTDGYFSHFYRRNFPRPYDGKRVRGSKVWAQAEFQGHREDWQRLEDWTYSIVRINRRYDSLVNKYCGSGPCKKTESELNDGVLNNFKEGIKELREGLNWKWKWVGGNKKTEREMRNRVRAEGGELTEMLRKVKCPPRDNQGKSPPK